MRKFSYQRQTAVIRTLKEPKRRKKRFNLDRLIYFAILAAVAFFILHYAYNTLAKVEANGFVQMEKVDVNFPNDIRLQELFIAEGDTVHGDQALFTFSENQFTDAGVYLRGTSAVEEQLQKATEVENQIALLKLRISGIFEGIQQLHKQEDQVRRWVLLDVATIDALNAVTERTLRENSRLELALGEMSILQDQLSNLRVEQATSNTGADFYRSTYYSPINGIIGAISKNEKESCYRMENVLTIHDTEDVRVKAYFSISDLEYIREGVGVDITFPDNSSHQGIIRKIYVATYEAPKEFQKKYEPTERNILADIVPAESSMVPSWGSFHKLNVSISLSK
ncbi:MAG: HlyD family efflux transporter periplasmic adaptor subunit [Bacteroidota bacterium]